LQDQIHHRCPSALSDDRGLVGLKPNYAESVSQETATVLLRQPRVVFPDTASPWGFGIRGGSACSYVTDSSTAVTYMVSVRLANTTVTETGAVQRTSVEGVLTNRSLAEDYEVTGVGLEPTTCGI